MLHWRFQASWCIFLCNLSSTRRQSLSAANNAMSWRETEIGHILQLLIFFQVGKQVFLLFKLSGTFMSCTLNGCWSKANLHLIYESWNLELQSKDLREAKSELGIHWAVTAITRSLFKAGASSAPSSKRPSRHLIHRKLPPLTL